MTDAVALVGGFLTAAVRVATPLLLAATGETVTERAGVINLGLEGMMLAGALAAALGASAAGPWTGIALAILAGMLLAAVFAGAAIGAGADQIIAGTAITLGAVGLTGTIYRQAYGTGGAGLACRRSRRSRSRVCVGSPFSAPRFRSARADLPRAAATVGGLVVSVPDPRRPRFVPPAKARRGAGRGRSDHPGARGHAGRGCASRGWRARPWCWPKSAPFRRR